MVREYDPPTEARTALALDLSPSPDGPERFEAAVGLAAGIFVSLLAEGVRVPLIALGANVHSVPVPHERSAPMAPGVGLDLLACAEESGSFAPERLLAELDARRGGVSALHLVSACRSDTHTRFADALRARGIEVSLHWIGDQPGEIDPAKIGAGEVVVLS